MPAVGEGIEEIVVGPHHPYSSSGGQALASRAEAEGPPEQPGWVCVTHSVRIGGKH